MKNSLQTPKEKLDQALQTYSNLMHEIKVRTIYIENSLNAHPNIPGRIVEESCYLQLRLICELIALACAVAHGDIVVTTQLKNEWKADQIIKALEEIHPNFYPVAYTHKRLGPAHHQITKLKTGFLTREDLPKLYGRSGSYLHKGSIKKLLKGKPEAPHDFTKIREWLLKIYTLLNVHEIALIDPSEYIMCMMRERGLSPQTSFVNAVPPREQSQLLKDRKKT